MEIMFIGDKFKNGSFTNHFLFKMENNYKVITIDPFMKNILRIMFTGTYSGGFIKL